MSSVELIKHVMHWHEITIAGAGPPVVRVDNTTVFYVLLGIVVLLIITTYLLKRSSTVYHVQYRQL